jgi:hypothetical protein
MFSYLVRRTVAVVLIGIIEAIFGAKEQASDAKNNGHHSENEFNIHSQKVKV